MKRILLGTTALLSVASLPAAAADLLTKAPVAAAVTNWTGCFVGVHAGGGSQIVSANQVIGGGAIAGGQAGCDYQTGSFVWGLEGRASWSGLVNRDDFSEPAATAFFNNNSFVVSQLAETSTTITKSLWNADVAARFGVAVDRALFYGKAGVAWGRFDFGLNSTTVLTPPPRPVTTIDNGSAVLPGFLLAAGVEYAMAPGWSARLEFDHVDYVSTNVQFAQTTIRPAGTFAAAFSGSRAATTNVVEAGLNYRFGGPNVPAAASVTAGRAPIYKASPAPIYTWSGCYAGLQGGGGTMSTSSLPVNGDGAAAGGQVGCDYQTGPMVLGLAGEGLWSGLGNHFESLNAVGPSQASNRNTWSFDGAARVGVALDRTLIYGKAGVAVGRFEFAANNSAVNQNNGQVINPIFNGAGTLTGVLFGAGIEHVFAPNWSAGVELDRIDYLSRELPFNANADAGGPFVASRSATTNMVKGEINYRFAGTAVPNGGAWRVPAPAQIWTGCYVGAHAGGGAMDDFFTVVNGAGAVAGGQVGCNYQTGRLVWGLEGEGRWSGLRNMFQAAVPAVGGAFPTPADAQEFDSRNPWSADVAARAGVAIDRALVYGKVGIAVGRWTFAATDVVQGFESGSTTLTGLLLAGGFEYAWDPRWSARFELAHIDYFGRVAPFQFDTLPFNQSTSMNADLVTVGFNYRFLGGPVVARY